MPSGRPLAGRLKPARALSSGSCLPSAIRGSGFWTELKDPTYLLITFAPRGWIYQNMCVGAPIEQVLLEALDIPNEQVLSGKLDEYC